jgi:hypothetical protein
MAELDPSIMAGFIGTEQWYRHGLSRNILYTEGAKYVADTAGAYWLLDEIAFSQVLPQINAEEFQVWKLKVGEAASSAMLEVEDGNDNVVYKKKIEYTDFPSPGINLWFQNNTIFLPSEY